jgi:mycothiol S-conjugate amidase
VAEIRRHRPQVLITYSDDQSGYPHPDHLKVHDISVLAFERAGDPTWYPEAGEPWNPAKLYYTVWAKARVVAVHEALLRLRGWSPYDESWLNRPGHDERLTSRIDVGAYLWARTGALKAHPTQVDPTEPWWFGLTDDELAEVYPYEDWVLARSHVGFPPEGQLEDDLFAGLRVRSEVGA